MAGVHTVAALSILHDFGSVIPEIARIIAAYPLEYIYGCLAADFFIGKGNARNPKHPHNWDGGFRFLRDVADSQVDSCSSHRILPVREEGQQTPRNRWSLCGVGKLRMPHVTGFELHESSNYRPLEK